MKSSFLHQCEITDAAGHVQYEFCLVEFELSPIRGQYFGEPLEGGEIEGLKVYNEAGKLITPGAFDLKYIEDEIFTNQIEFLLTKN